MGWVLRIVIFALLAWVIWRLLQTLLAKARGEVPGDRSRQAFEPMSRCASCGVHVPRTELDDQDRCPRCRGA